jgi:hypothetical protein
MANNNSKVKRGDRMVDGGLGVGVRLWSMLMPSVFDGLGVCLDENMIGVGVCGHSH